MNRKWLKGLITALAVFGCFITTPILAQQTTPTTVPPEYQGLLDFTKALPADLSGNEGMKTFVTQAITSFFSSKDVGFSAQNSASSRTSDSMGSVGPAIILTLLQYVFNPQNEVDLTTRQNNFTINSNLNDLPSVNQNTSARYQTNDGGPFSFFKTDSDKDTDFQNPFLFQ